MANREIDILEMAKEIHKKREEELTKSILDGVSNFKNSLDEEALVHTLAQIYRVSRNFTVDLLQEYHKQVK